MDTLARRIAGLPPGVAAAARTAVDAADEPMLDASRQQNVVLGEVFGAPAAQPRARDLLAAGAQTREVERDLEGLLNRL